MTNPLIAVVVLLGCGGSPAADGVEAPHLTPPRASGLVWLRELESGVDRTLWVSLEDGALLSGQAIEGAVWADGHTLWQYLEESEDVPLYEEEPVGEAPDPSEATTHATVRRAVLRELVGDARVVVVEAPEPGPAREVRHRLTLEGSAGPLLFFVQHLYIDSFAAHGVEDASAIVWDLGAAAPASIETERELASWNEEATVRVRRQMGPAVDPRELARLALVALHPRWELDGGLRMQLHVAVPACYACSDGDWSDYTISLRFDLPTLPERIDGTLPEWARAAAERAGGTLLGFTLVEHPEPAQILDSLSH